MNIFPLNIIWIALGIIVIFGAFAIIKIINEQEGGETSEKKTYDYQAKQFIMTKNEHDAFDTIVATVGTEYYVFPQVKLDKILDWKGNGKNALYAMRHIYQKSVDFLLCDKKYLNPKLAIELDDSTHDREDRRTRDAQVEEIFASAHFPLLRITHFDLSNLSELKEKIWKSL